jgi:mono/diheme cytochrome c family protein
MKAGNKIVCVLLAGLLWASAIQADALEGAELYAEYCQNCHGESKAGLVNFSMDLAAFTDRLEGMTEQMPDFADFFAAEEIASLHSYLSADGE